MSLQTMRMGLHTNPPTLMATRILALPILESQTQACQISLILMRFLPIVMPMTRWAQWAPLPFGTPPDLQHPANSNKVSFNALVSGSCIS